MGTDVLWPCYGIGMCQAAALLLVPDTPPYIKRQSPLCMIYDHLCVWKGDHLCTWKGYHLCTWKSDHLINQWLIAERINSQLSHGKFKRFNLFFLHVGIKTVYITVYNQHREDQQSLCMKTQWPLHMKR